MIDVTLIITFRSYKTNATNMRLSVIMLLLFAGFFSCAEKRAETFNFADRDLEVSKISEDAQAPPNEQTPVAAVERKLIRNGSMTLEIKDIEETRLAIEKVCKELNAWISNEHQAKYDHRIQYTAEIRVEASKFDELIKQLEKLAISVDEKTINTQDVTEEFIDVEARLKTKRELEARYHEILKQAKSVTDILSIEGQLNSVRAEIESAQGRLNYLKNQVAYSTLNLSYYQNTRTDFGFFSKVGNAFTDGWENLLAFLLVLLQLWPFVISAIVAVYFFIRFRKRKATLK